MEKQPRQFSSRWFRMYDEAVDDPKIQTLGDKLGFFWMNCLCLASKNGGYLPPLSDIAWKLRKRKSDVSGMVATLYERGLLDREGTTFSPHNWSGRQFQSDFSRERVERYRDRVRANGGKVGAYLKHKHFVFERDGGACVYCGSTDKLVLDHMVPVIAGGDDDPMNLCCCCKRCNAGKAGRTPDQAGMSFINAVSLSLYQKNLSRLQAGSDTVTVTAPEQNRTDTEQKQSRAEQNSPLPAPRLVPLNRRIEVAREPDFCEIDDWFEERISRHPKRGKNLMLAKTMISQLAEVADPAWRAQFTRVHELWIASPSWTGKNLHFAPSMDQWIADKGWKYEPPAVESDTEKAWASL